MALTQRGKVVTGVAVVVTAAAAVLAVLAFTGNAPPAIQAIVDKATGKPTPCPLTGELRAGGKGTLARPVLAVKVENTDEAYPLAGLERADVIYEEPVEGSITRFAALFQCRDAAKVGPVRSARTTDPRILVQYSDEPLLAYSGANPTVAAALEKAGVVSLTETSANEAFVRDESRSAPHNLFASTKKLYCVRQAVRGGLLSAGGRLPIRRGGAGPEQAADVRVGGVLQLQRRGVGLVAGTLGSAARRRADARGERRRRSPWTTS